MRYAIVSDLHANLEALSAVLQNIQRERIDQVVCLGDIVGYNASPNEVVELVLDRGICSIAGNHDRAATYQKDAANFGALGRRAIEWTRRTLRPELTHFLGSLPSQLLVDGRFFAVHGALHPQPNDELHLSNDARVARSFQELLTGRFGAKICFFGHTHRAVIYEHARGILARRSHPVVELEPGAHYMINPGSVGQPRDGDPRAAYAVFDSAKATVELKRVDYDVNRAARRARAEGLLDEVPFMRRSVVWMGHKFGDGRDLLQRGLNLARKHVPGG